MKKWQWRFQLLDNPFFHAFLPVIVTIFVFTFPRIPQDLAYHNFADGRGLFGISNLFDVVSNLPFIVVGMMGLYFIHQSGKKALFTMKGEKVLWQIFFFGAVLIGLGSVYYHLAPNNATIVWDRLPMTIAFMSFFPLMIMERVNARGGLILSPLLLVIGVGSVLYWDYTESLGRGDLRLYVVVQFLPLLMIPLLLWFYSPHYTGVKYIWFTLGWYVFAKVLETYDKEVFDVLGGVVSGHTLKHIAAAMGVWMMLVYLKRRSVVSHSY